MAMLTGTRNSRMNRYIIYLTGGWHEQFWLQDLLDIEIPELKITGSNKLMPGQFIKPTCTNFENYTIERWKNRSNIQDIIGNNIFIFNSNINAFKALNLHAIELERTTGIQVGEFGRKYFEDLIKFLKPNIVIHGGDEWGTRPEYQELHKHTGLLLRQYYHDHYSHENCEYIPLGYMNGMFESNYLSRSLKPPTTRKYDWSFVGVTRKDREEMIHNMMSIDSHYVYSIGGKGYGEIENNIVLNDINALANTNGNRYKRKATQEVRDIYRESIFVPNGRGNVVIDCLRLYEASACGSIPVVVGTQQDFKVLCKEENPPWLFYNSWPQAVTELKKLLQNKHALNERSSNVTKWWKQRIHNIKEKIKTALIQQSQTI